MLVDFKLQSVSPLLFHADDIEASDRLKEWREDPANKDMSVRGDDRSPAWTWQTYLYPNDDQLAIPSTNLMTCLRQAGAKMILKKQKTFKEITQSGMLVRSEFITFLGGDGKPVPMAPITEMADEPFKVQADRVRDMGFYLFMKRAPIGRAKHVRVRARFNKWSVRGQLEVTAPEITAERVQQLFELAGNVGLLDWRHGCRTPGSFGMYTAQLKFS